MQFTIDNYTNTVSFERIISSDDLFQSFVYTPVNQVKKELRRRWADKILETKVNKTLGSTLPTEFQSGFLSAIFRHVCTPNFELEEFLDISQILGLRPMLGEYTRDKFTSNNICKYYLGRIPLYSGIGRNGGMKIKYENIIDFNIADGKSLTQVETDWGQSLIEFHHELLYRRYSRSLHSHIFDCSDWFSKQGFIAKQYYQKFLTLFLRNGVLFENFELEETQERKFALEQFLPAFTKIWQETGEKPLIVNIMSIEPVLRQNWMCYDPIIADYIAKKRQLM